MNTHDKDSPLLYALATLTLILGVALVAQAWRSSRVTAILNTPPHRIIVSQPPDALNLTDDLRIIQDHALFYATREFYSPVLATAVTTPAQLSSYQLLGTLLIPKNPGVAFVRRSPSDTTMTLSPGQEVDGWAVRAVQSGRVVFSYRDQVVTLTIKPDATQSRE
jgi:hypothetical protein